MTVLAIDQGTTSTRALRIDDDGAARLVGQIEHKQFYPKPGWVEHDPEELVSNILDCIEGCDDIAAIGIDNQGESCLAWDAKSKQPISSVIVWQDNRTAGEISRLLADGAAHLVTERAGLPLDSYFSATKFAWLLENIPRARELLILGRLRLGTTDAFFHERLTGRFVTDITTASRTALLNLNSGQWDPDLCRLFGVPVECLPEIVATTGDFGSIRHKGRDVPVTASVVDQQASLYGHGCRQAGDRKITFGTGAFALGLTGEKLIKPDGQALLPTIAWQFSGKPPVYALDGGIYCAGSAINWARSLGLFDDYQSINAFDSPPAIERDLAFVPALAGLASPYWDRSAAGLWIGMSLDTTAMDLVQSVLEGIAFRATEVMGEMNNHMDAGKSLSIDGGVSANPYFCQFLSNLLNIEVRVNNQAELTALGTAWLASELEQPAPDSTRDKRYQPKKDMQPYLIKFDTAVQRSRQWQQVSPG